MLNQYLTLFGASWLPQSMYSPFLMEDCYKNEMLDEINVDTYSADPPVSLNLKAHQ